MPEGRHDLVQRQKNLVANVNAVSRRAAKAGVPAEAFEKFDKSATGVVNLEDTYPEAIRPLDALPQVWTDAVLLERVFFNLLDNAAKYAPASKPITLAIRAETSQAIITIEDHGPGIPPTEREQVFDMFHRVQRGDTKAAGTGMGLFGNWLKWWFLIIITLGIYSFWVVPRSCSEETP